MLKMLKLHVPNLNSGSLHANFLGTKIRLNKKICLTLHIGVHPAFRMGMADLHQIRHMADSYLTISSPSEAVFTEKRSRFLAFAFPVTTVEEVKDHVGRLSKKYFDARHVCYAYMLGAARDTFRANDNGEPSGTAGKPILGQINSLQLTDVLVVVVRYFGGIKLGTPGLIAAYRAAAREALDNADIITLHQTALIAFIYPYIVINDVMKLTRLPGVETLSSTFDNTCAMTLRVELDSEPMLRSRLADINGLSVIE